MLCLMMNASTAVMLAGNQAKMSALHQRKSANCRLRSGSSIVPIRIVRLAKPKETTSLSPMGLGQLVSCSLG